MSKITKYWPVVGYAVIVGAVISMRELGPSTTQATPGSAPVAVINTPLPVQGTVDAAQSGSWNVGITGSPGVTVANANSQPVPTLAAGASLVTHVGQLPSNQVVLFADTEGCPSWSRVNPDGTEGPFTIPTGDDLVITDTDLLVSGNTPGNWEVFGLRWASAPLLLTFALADSTGAAASNEHLTTGLVVSVLPTCSPLTIGEIWGYLIPAS